MKQYELFSYVYDFTSQLLDNKIIFSSLKRIILFGSVARGDIRKESDVDLFIDLKYPKEQKEINNLIKKEINKFEARSEKTWFLRGIDFPIKVIVGSLEQGKWEDLREEILSYGTIIYGRFEEKPEKLEHKILIDYNLKKLSQRNKMAFLRKLYGYVLRKQGKEYVQKGLISEIKGEKIGAKALLVKAEDLMKIKSLLKRYLIKYGVRDVWLKQ